MKLTFKLFTLAAIMALFAIPAWSQAKECTDDFKQSTYSKWYDNRKDHQDIAYQAAKEYLSTCQADDSPYATALKKFAKDYEAATSDATNKNQLQAFMDKKNYSEAVRVGKQVVTGDPDYVKGYILITLAAYNSNDAALLADSVQYAQKAIQLIEAGKPVPVFNSKDSAIGWMNYVIAKANLKSAPADAVGYYLKAARLDNDLKKTPGLYVDLAQAYNDGPLAKLADDYQTKFAGKDKTPESELAVANIYQLMDRRIDALARAAALVSGNDKKAFIDLLTVAYKERNKSDAGVNELVAGILSKPLPDEPKPLTSLPTPAATPTPMTGSQPATSGSSTPPATNKPATNPTTSGNKSGNSNTTTTATKPPVAKPSPTPKPRSRANHRRG